MPYIKNFPSYRQSNNDTCGPAALQAILAYYGIDFKESFISKIAGTTSSGAPIEGLKRVAKAFGLKTKEGTMSIKDLRENIKKGIPTIIAIQAWAPPGVNIENEWRHGHFVVPIKYTKHRIYFADPSCAVRTYLTNTELERRWRDKDKYRGKWRRIDHFGISFFGLKFKFNLNNARHMGHGKFSKVHDYCYGKL